MGSQVATVRSSCLMTVGEICECERGELFGRWNVIVWEEGWWEEFLGKGWWKEESAHVFLSPGLDGFLEMAGAVIAPPCSGEGG